MCVLIDELYGDIKLKTKMVCLIKYGGVEVSNKL